MDLTNHANELMRMMMTHQERKFQDEEERITTAMANGSFSWKTVMEIPSTVIHPGFLCGRILSPGDARVGTYFGYAGMKRLLARVLPEQPRALIRALAALYAQLEGTRYERDRRSKPRCDRCQDRSDKGCASISGDHEYIACRGGCVAELALSALAAQTVLSRLDGFLPWFPLLSVARSDPDSAFAGWPVEVLFAIVDRMFEPYRLPASGRPPWAW